MFASSSQGATNVTPDLTFIWYCSYIYLVSSYFVLVKLVISCCNS
jgi:hypothetical protein